MLGSVGTDNYGLTGLEQSLEDELHGTDGTRKIVKDATGKPVSIVDVERAEAGEDVRLTIDAAIQERTEAVLSEVGQLYRPRGATAVVMDPRNGEVLAMANWPRIDANNIDEAPEYARQNRAVGFTYDRARLSRRSRSRERSRRSSLRRARSSRSARRSWWPTARSTRRTTAAAAR